MLLRAKKLLTTDLVKVSFLNAVATLIKMLTGFVSVKVVAAIIGPVGVALLGQLNNFVQILLSVSNGGINSGITKYTAEYADSEKDYILYLGTGFWITVVLSVLTSLVLVLGAGYFSISILHDIQYKPVFYIFGGTLLFYALNALLTSVINGFKEYKKYVISNIVGSIVGLLFSVVLAVKYTVFGALVATVTFQSIVFFITLGLIAKSYWFKWKSFLLKFNKGIAVKLGHYSLMAIVSAVTVPAGQIIVRSFIISKNSITDAGLWEGINRISGMYLMVITASLGVYFLPKLSELKSKKELRKEVLTVYKLVIPFLILTTSVIFIFRVFIIHVLFTQEFIGMRDLFAFQLIGDILKILGWVLGYLLLAKAMTKIYIIMELVNFVLLVIMSYFLVNLYGSIGATLAFAIVYFIYFAVLCFVFRNLLFNKN
ncbi:MAG: O-antigen translocase [Bacteroidota bacterium]|nr:O-antigen translocase [Bacteroidota bacterium]MDP4251015.1 O-antigen translocase [Bacteroidota bacterium]